ERAKAALITRIAFLDDNTILAGERGEVRAAIDRVKTGRLAAARTAILRGASELASNNAIWMAIDIPASAIKEAPPAAAEMLAGVRGAELGISFDEGFGLQLNVRTKDDASATSAAQALQGLIAIGAMSQSQSPQAVDALKKLRITPEGSRVKMALALDRAE